MTTEQQNEVWRMLDREHLVQVVRQGPEPIFATISGAHLYGFASPDSDVAVTTSLPEDVDQAQVEELAVALMMEASR